MMLTMCSVYRNGDVDPNGYFQSGSKPRESYGL